MMNSLYMQKQSIQKTTTLKEIRLRTESRNDRETRSNINIYENVHHILFLRDSMVYHFKSHNSSKSLTANYYDRVHDMQ